MGYKRAAWHSGLTYQQTCTHCRTLVRYNDYSLGFRAWYPDGFVYCPRCKAPMRHNELYAIRPDGTPVYPQPVQQPYAQQPYAQQPYAQQQYSQQPVQQPVQQPYDQPSGQKYDQPPVNQPVKAFCTYCGEAYLKGVDRFCGKCGSRVE